MQHEWFETSNVYCSLVEKCHEKRIKLCPWTFYTWWYAPNNVGPITVKCDVCVCVCVCVSMYKWLEWQTTEKSRLKNGYSEEVQYVKSVTKYEKLSRQKLAKKHRNRQKEWKTWLSKGSLLLLQCVVKCIKMYLNSKCSGALTLTSQHKA